MILFTLTFFYTVSLFIVPLTLEAGAVSGLDGNANMIDYQNKWSDLPVYHRTIYSFSDFNCHQKAERSYSIGGNQMPVCARDVGIFIGMSIGFFLMMFVKAKRDFKDILLNLLPMDTNLSQKEKSYLLIVLGLIFILPMALDGGIQLVTAYESNNPLRTITGLLFGSGFSLFISSIFISSFKDIRREDF